MLIGLSGKLTGYNGTFAFNKPGDKYGDHKYLGMRLFCVILGTLIIPFCFIIVWELTKSLPASFLASALITFGTKFITVIIEIMLIFNQILAFTDVGLLTLSQYILLDPILMFFVIGSFLGSVKFFSVSSKPFSKIWWFWLAFTGFFLASAIRYCVN